MTTADRRARRAKAWLVAFAVVAALACTGFAALGQWQLARRAWKLDLIARVERRANEAAVAAPAIDAWPRLSADRDEYRRVRVSGVFLHDRETRVQAATELGSGHWLLTPLRTADGSVVLVNRGFVPAPPRAQRPAEPAGETTVTGLLRLSQPGGGFLRRNDPATDRWHSRDVQAVATARRLNAPVAPYFIDADARRPDEPQGDASGPVGGLTVTVFSNNHLAYAITWYALAAGTAVAAWRVVRAERQRRTGAGDVRADD